MDFHVNYSIYSQNLVILEFFDRFSKILHIFHSTKIHSLQPSSFVWTEGETVVQTNLTKLIVAFRRLSNASRERYTINR